MTTRFPEFLESTDPLGEEAEFDTGPQVASSPDFAIVGTVYTDQAGTLYVEQGPDGENWDTQKVIEVGAEEGQSFDEPCVAAYWRVRFVNGETEQGEFRIAAGPRGGGLSEGKVTNVATAIAEAKAAASSASLSEAIDALLLGVGKGFAEYDAEAEEWPERPKGFASVEWKGPEEAGEPPEFAATDTRRVEA
jgi:hypothetical protein